MVEIINVTDIHTYNDLPLVKYADDMKYMLSKLKYIGINYFAYSVMHKDGTREVLSANPSFAELFIQEKFYKIAFCGDINNFHDGYYLFKDLTCPTVFSAMQEHCHISGGVIITKCYADTVDLFYFGHDFNVVCDNNFYIKNVLIFETFINEFYEELYCILIKSRKKRILYTDGFGDTSNLTKLPDSADFSNPNKGYCELLFQQKLKEIALKYKLTLSEFRAMKLLANGMSSKEAAQEMNVSYRTIEKHYDVIKKKTNSRSLLHFLSLLSKNDL